MTAKKLKKNILVCYTYSTNPDTNGNCNYMEVQIEPDLATLILKRAERFDALFFKDTDAVETYYWNSAARYYSSGNRTIDKLECGEFKFVTKTQFHEEMLQRTECDQLIIGPRGFRFTAIPKHTDIYVESPEIPYDAIKGVEYRF